MHNLNLGIVAIANGSSLLLTSTSWLTYFWGRLHSLNNTPIGSPTDVIELRLLLAQLGYFGDVEELSLPDRLVIAYKDFKAWCKQNKVQSSQTLFTVGSATLMKFGHQIFR